MRVHDPLPDEERTSLASCGIPELSARRWLVKTQPALQHLLPRPHRPILLTDDMVDARGEAIDVFAYFNRRKEDMQRLTGNWWAMQHTAQSIQQSCGIEHPPEVWDGFESVWIPVGNGVELHGFFGLAEGDGRVIKADCLVLLPGLLGDNGAKRADYLSRALRDRGFHVLSLEVRGHGQTDVRHPQAYYTYGLLELQDLMKVSEWLLDNHASIRRTGLVGFCWGANKALLAAWFDGRSPDDPDISPYLQQLLEPPTARRHFTAGIIAFSPVPRWEEYMDTLDRPRSVWQEPSPAMFQIALRKESARKGLPEITGNLRHCIAYSIAGSELGPTFPVQDGYRFLRLMPYRHYPGGHKLESARVPVLIVHAVNDPLQTAQEVADLIALTRNPNVAAIILPGGGHIGFQAYSRTYFYNLLLSFFDPHCGAAPYDPDLDDRMLDPSHSVSNPHPAPRQSFSLQLTADQPDSE